MVGNISSLSKMGTHSMIHMRTCLFLVMWCAHLPCHGINRISFVRLHMSATPAYQPRRSKGKRQTKKIYRVIVQTEEDLERMIQVS
jgi:hypothetical protein